MEGNNLHVYGQQQQMLDDGDGFDLESIVLRRADPDDCDQIINLVEIGKDDVYNRVYSYPKVLKLIETSYLAITVLDREGRVVAFAAFEDCPQGMRGMYDEKHYNYWEPWFRKAFNVDEFSTYNTAWLTYFIAGGSIAYSDQRYAFKKILQTVYTSMPDIIGVLFLMRGDADEDDLSYCFDPLREYFQELECHNRDVLKEVRGIHHSSHVYFSSRLLVLPYVEIRDARQEDHDDLADVFNSQSETVTEAYGEYFIAELIAAQGDNNKALVAQVKDKAVGLMGLTSEVDVKLLHQCFELNSFDNLLKPEFMNAVRARREALLDEKKRQAELERLAELRRLKEETMKCNMIAQRISLQEFLMINEQTITKGIDELMQNEEEIKNFTKEMAEQCFESYLSGFRLTQPSTYFEEHPTNDHELSSNILSEKEFMLQTLEIFGLPQRYMEGNGHFPDWGKDSLDRAAAAKKRALQSKQKQKKTNAAMARLKQARGLDTKEETDKKPTHFDLGPFLKALKRFLLCNGETRSRLRIDLRDNLAIIKKIFIDEYGEASYKKCVNITEFGKLLSQKGINLDQKIVENIGAIMICFGDIQYEIKTTWRLPEETEEEKRAAAIKKMKEEEEKKALAEGGEATKKKKVKGDGKGGEEEEKKEEPQKKEPPKPVKTWLFLTSIFDLINSLEKMHDYDFILNEMGVMTFDLSWEKEKLSKSKLGGDKQKVQAKGLNHNQSARSLSQSESQSVLGASKSHAHESYSDDFEYNRIVRDLDDLETIPDPPEKAKNAFAITLFCMEAAFDSRSKDFLKHAFDRFPDRDYLIVTQPHTVAENSLLQKFTLVPKKPENTFTHVLYIIHRDSLYEEDLIVQRGIPKDLDGVKELLDTLEDKKSAFDQIYEATVNPDSQNLSFVCKIGDDVVGAFLLAKDINLEYYKSHFHIQDAILMNEHERKAHTRLIFSVINPIFERCTRYILKELMRLSSNTCLYFEIHDRTVIPTIFHELVHVRSRRFPHFLDRKWDHERYIAESQQQADQQIPADGRERDPQDELESPFALCFTTKRLLSEPKIIKNSRIVVVGASDTGISFIEALLSISYLQFTNIVLIAPGGLPHHHCGDDKGFNLKSASTSYTQQELKRLMLETRVRVINARMVDIDRSDKNIILHDETVVPYDTLVLGMGLQDKTLQSMGFVSRGIAPLPKDKRRLEGLISVDDPYLYSHLRQGSTLMNALTNRRRPQNCVIYGRTLHAYCTIKGLIQRGMRAEQISLVLPGPICHLNEGYDNTPEDEEEMMADLPFINPQAFEDEYIEGKIHRILEAKGVRIVRNAKLIEITEDISEPGQLESVVFKLLDIPDEEEDEDELEGIDEEQNHDHQERDSKMSSGGGGAMDNESAEGGELGENKSQTQGGEGEQVVAKKKRKKNELELHCRVLITAGHKDVDGDVFNSIHNNGLVYNGRLIVDKNFQTTDPSIFSAGPLCEFSGRYKAISQGRPLRMDRYNGREMGSRLARSVFDIYDPSSASSPVEGQDELPTFYLPQGQGGVLPGNLIYYHIKTTNPLVIKPGSIKEVKNRKDLVSDNLSDDTNKGHFIKFTFNSIGLIDSVTYIGSEEVILQSLWSFVGLHENYLNSLTSRFEKGIIPNVVEFLSENWAIALYHEWFGDFCLRMRQSIQGLRDVQGILEKAFEGTKHGEGIDRDQFRELRKLIDPKTVKMIEDETLEFIKTNMNHLPMYYIPGEEFP